MGFGYGNAIGKIFDWLPGRAEHRRNKIDAIQREMDRISQGESTIKSRNRYAVLAERMRVYREKAKNA